MTLNSDQRQQVLDKVRDLVLTRHINAVDPDQDYSPWTAELQRRRPEILHSPAGDFEQQLQSLLAALKSSHTAFFHGNGSAIPAQYAINATLTRVEWSEDGARWMFCDVVEDGPAHQSGIRPGHLLLRQAGKDVLPPSTPSFRIGESCVLTILGRPDNAARDILVNVPNQTLKDRPPMTEPKSLIYRMLKPGLGYIKVHTFPGANGSAFARSLDGAVRELIGSKAEQLVVDLRGNMGGGIGSLRLMSYLCPGSLPIGYSLTRKKYTSGFDKHRLITIKALPDGRAATLWMFVKFRLLHKDRSVAMFTESLGAQPFHHRIIVLINEHTKSAAEMVASFAQENGLATLVGTRTAGEVLGGVTFDVGHGYRLRIPVAGWYNWEGVCIEGAGVNPTAVVLQDPKELAAGNDPQLAAAVRLASSM